MSSTALVVTLLAVWLVPAFLLMRFTRSMLPLTRRDVVECFAWPAILVIGLYQFFKSEK